MPHYRQSSKNHPVLIQHPFIDAPPLFLSPSLQAYVAEEVFPANIGDDNNQPIDNLAIEVVALHHQQELANAQQVPDLEAQSPSAVAVDESLIANHRRDILLTKLILSVAVYFCPTFIVKPMTPLRFRMTIPIILHLVCAFVALVLVILLIIDPMLPVRLLFPS
ncbi:hypothetical protein BGZ97_006900 [Linnemannia gamsii]|jgi:hypothetical protein|uniref:Uncharacterized protein n=1 Tax=Linnemannia gamsii TaxID=64522 RepID=A0A9P6UEE3_9FUNG|nr:hypothetical protein BGZ97_006900 [Linnemannia gamsii]